LEKKKGKIVVPILIALTIGIILFPLFLLPGAEFSGSDGAGSDMVDEVTGDEFVPWFEPLMERAIGGELPGEMESFFFCIQTGIGVGILAFCFGWLAARKKYNIDPADGGDNTEEKVS
jgi:cobalt/nickel transport protein